MSFLIVVCSSGFSILLFGDFIQTIDYHSRYGQINSTRLKIDNPGSEEIKESPKDLEGSERWKRRFVSHTTFDRESGN